MNLQEALKFFKDHFIGFYSESSSLIKYKNWYFIMNAGGSFACVNPDTGECEISGEGSEFLIDGKIYGRKHP